MMRFVPATTLGQEDTALRVKLPCGCVVQWIGNRWVSVGFDTPERVEVRVRGARVLVDAPHYDVNGHLFNASKPHRITLRPEHVAAGYAMAAARGVGPWAPFFKRRRRKEPRLLGTKEKLSDALAAVEQELVRRL